MPWAAPTYCFRCHWYKRGQRSVFLSSLDKALPDSMMALTTYRRGGRRKSNNLNASCLGLINTNGEL